MLLEQLKEKHISWNFLKTLFITKSPKAEIPNIFLITSTGFNIHTVLTNLAQKVCKARTLTGDR